MKEEVKQRIEKENERVNCLPNREHFTDSEWDKIITDIGMSRISFSIGATFGYHLRDEEVNRLKDLLMKAHARGGTMP